MVHTLSHVVQTDRKAPNGEERQPVTELFIDLHALRDFVLSSKRRAIASHSARLPVL
jgi:hypothetical protein